MAYSALVLGHSPLIYWRLGEANSLVASDASGNGRDGEVVTNGPGGPPWQGEPGAIDGDPDTSTRFFWRSSPTNHMRGVAFGPAVDHPEIRVQHTGKLAAAVWYKADADYNLGQGALMRVSNPDANTSDSSWRLNVLADGNIEIRGRNTGTPPATTGVNVLDGRWHFIGAEWEHDGVNYARRIYVDGVLRASSTATYDVTATNSQHLRVGYSGFGTVNQQRLSGWYDEFFLLDHHLSPSDWRELWYEARQGSIDTVAVHTPITVPDTALTYAQIVDAVAVSTDYHVGQHSMREPALPASVVDLDDQIPGVWMETPPGVALLGSVVDLEDSIPGLVMPPRPETVRPAYLASVSGLSIIPGTFHPTPAVDPDVPIKVPVPPSPAYPDGWMTTEGRMSVSGATDLTDASCRPALSDVGTGSYTHRGAPPAIGSIARFTVAGSTVMTGLVTDTRDRKTDPGEEASQLVTATVAGTASELDRIVVLPDFGAMEITRHGPPTQLVRYFDITANGAGDWSGEGPNFVPGPTRVPRVVAQGIDAWLADRDGLIPLPSEWVDTESQWLHWHSPRLQAGRGWSTYRIATGHPPAGRPIQIWFVMAGGFGECWIDGVKLLESNTPGKAVHMTLPHMRADYHLVHVRTYASGGAHSGFMFSMLPVNRGGGFGRPIMNSRSGWTGLPYKDAFIYTPGAVLHRLFYEANYRRNQVAGRWRLNFSIKSDSNGRPWPVPEEPIQLDVGMSYLDVLRRLSETYLDWDEGPGGRTLNAYVKGSGTGRSRGIPWATGVDALSRVHARGGRQ